MTFEEFFRKKKINLALFKQAEPVLFAEFETHYEAMGEKSFDHTKKYWFNKLRRQYILPPEPKIEKVILENQLAEQTVVESLTEPVTEKPKAGFTPRFKAGAIVAKPVEEPPAENKAEEPKPEEPAKLKVSFTPRFKAGITTKSSEAPQADNEEESKAEEPAKPKVGFTPRFKAGSTVAKPAEETSKEEPKIEGPTKPKVGFTPRFKPPQK